MNLKYHWYHDISVVGGVDRVEDKKIKKTKKKLIKTK
jgi:hypothetical protein